MYFRDKRFTSDDTTPVTRKSTVCNLYFWGTNSYHLCSHAHTHSGMRERPLISYPSHSYQHFGSETPAPVLCAVSFPGSLDLQGHSSTAPGLNDFCKRRCCIKDSSTEDVALCILYTMTNPFFHSATFKWLRGRVRKSDLWHSYSGYPSS